MSSGRVQYPDIYKAKPNEKAVEEQTNKDFWDMNLDEKDKENAGNDSFWGDALGDSKPAPAPSAPPRNEKQAEIQR